MMARLLLHAHDLFFSKTVVCRGKATAAIKASVVNAHCIVVSCRDQPVLS